jgi:hypothetical protein
LDNIRVILDNIRVILDNIRVILDNIHVILDNIHVISDNIHVISDNVHVVSNNIHVIQTYEYVNIFPPLLDGCNFTCNLTRCRLGDLGMIFIIMVLKSNTNYI